MNDRIPCEFHLIRYVPNVVRDEFVNIGVILRAQPPAGSLAEARFTRQWNRLQHLDPHADVDLLRSLADDIAIRLNAEASIGNSTPGSESIMDLMAKSFSNSIQVTDARASLADTFVGEMDRLMRMYVDPPLNN